VNALLAWAAPSRRTLPLRAIVPRVRIALIRILRSFEPSTRART
jgi:hypothetical protein